MKSDTEKLRMQAAGEADIISGLACVRDLIENRIRYTCLKIRKDSKE